ncbi:hypothetical protein [Adhaeribacter aquaticus]|nr:hypothetical protein [Adhaeribacter aquaticus]
MSKDKGGKNLKKAPSADGHKGQSDYQAGKSGGSKTEIMPTNLKKK